MNIIKKSLIMCTTTHPICNKCVFGNEENCKSLLMESAAELIDNLENERDYYLGKAEVLDKLIVNNRKG